MFPKALLPGSLSVFLCAAAAGAEAIPDWPAPTSWTAPRALHGVATLGDVSSPLPFIAATPCRVADTRGNGFTGAYGPPSLAANTTRSFTIPGQCGIPAGAAAVSFNFTALNIGGPGDLRVFPAGGGVPLVSTLNYNANTPNIANAAVVPLGGGGAITVQADAVSVDLIIDLNGYYASTPALGSNPFRVSNSGVRAIWGETNSPATDAVGVYGLASASTGLALKGVWGDSESDNFGIGVFGRATATSGTTFGVYGRTQSFFDGSSGAFGESLSSAGKVYGVTGVTASSNVFSAGVYGVTSEVASNAGHFLNQTPGLNTYLAFQSSGANYGLLTNGRIFGAALEITGMPKNFVSPHPTDPSRVIKYASVEAPTVDVYFRGTGTLSNGYARIEVPDHFRFTAREGTYMTTLTPVGRPGSLSVESEGPEGIVVRGSGNARFHYVVYAERAEVEGYEPIQPNVVFTPELLEKGQLLRALPRTTRALLVKNGTLNEDGTYNQETARSMGWVIPETAPAGREK